MGTPPLLPCRAGNHPSDLPTGLHPKKREETGVGKEEDEGEKDGGREEGGVMGTLQFRGTPEVMGETPRPSL